MSATTLLSAAELAGLAGLSHAPTPEQTAVIEAPLAPLLVVAGAGSGKTETMAARVVWLVENGLVAPGEILGLTFTRKAAAELADRVNARLRAIGRRRRGAGPLLGEERPRIATYNAYAGGLVRDHGLRVGADPDAHLLTEAGRWQLASRVVEAWTGDLPADVAPSTVTGAILDLSGALAEHLLTPRQAALELDRLAEALEAKSPAPSGRDRHRPRADVAKVAHSLRRRRDVMAVVAEFERRKQELRMLDFADQVALACRIASDAPDVRQTERARYRVVLLDEYQDTSVAQVALLSDLFGDGHAVTAVGDPHQAIYGWRGASAGSVERFPTTFPAADGSPAATATLSTSWRNDRAVLAAANVLAGPLRARSGAVPLPVLGARPGAGNGRVAALYAQTAPEEAAAVAETLATMRGAAGELPASTAVLCRTRAQMPVLAEALRAQGLPVEVVGLGGLLSTPEVADLHAALLAAHDPARADAAMRLLTGRRLGVSDLAVLDERARELARSGKAGSLQSEPASLLEAVDRPPPPGWSGRSGRQLSPMGHARVAELGAVLRSIRAQSHLPLPELVAVAERLLGLDIEVRARSGADLRTARRNLDEFADVAAGFVDGSAEPGLGAFLGWLEAAAEHERGLEKAEVEVDAAAVQVLTVHAAKGLEWDVVAVVGCAEGTFPSYDGPVRDDPSSSAWLTALGTLPYPLRADAADLPELNVEAAGDHAEMAAEVAGFRERAGAHLLDEERRLAYVALTRARRDLVLSGAWWKDRSKTSRRPSRFLAELRRAGAVSELLGDPGWSAPDAEENPLDASRRAVTWPVLPAAEHAEAVRRSVEAVVRARAGYPADPPTGMPSPRAQAWARDARLLLAERAEASRPPAAPALPAHLSASAVVRLLRDPDKFALDQRRPVPVEPTVGARRGTRFHAWVERHFAAATLLDLDDLLGAQDDAGQADAELETLQRAFLDSPWAERTPLAVEVGLETPVGGTVIRCRVDAVFPTSDGVQIVDWKTGPPPGGHAQARAVQAQLALYRLAWSRLSGMPLEAVGACFVHVASGLVVPAEELSEPQIVALVAAHLQAGAVNDPG